jgi:hypothetical protein
MKCRLRIPKLSDKQLDRLWKKVKVGSRNDCWPWTGATNEEGRGNLGIGKKTYLASRVIYQLTYGVDPGPLDVTHRCDNPPCCNPRHFALDTHLGNMRQMYSRKRRPHPVGERNGSAKLTVKDIRRIRRLRGKVTQVALAKEYGVSQVRISQIQLRKRNCWKTP